MRMKKTAVFLIILFLSSTWLGNSLAEEMLTWQDCLAEAKKNHPDLISAVETINEEKAGKAIAASGLYPQVEASLGASTSETESSNGTKTTTDSYSYGLSGRQLIFDGLKTANDIKTAKQNLKVAEENFRFVSSEVRLALRSAFVNLLKAQELVRVAEDIVNIRRDSLMLITLRYESGLEHKGALLTAQANVAEANFGLAQAKRDIELAQRQLTKEMGRREFKPLSVKGDFIVRETAKMMPTRKQQQNVFELRQSFILIPDAKKQGGLLFVPTTPYSRNGEDKTSQSPLLYPSIIRFITLLSSCNLYGLIMAALKPYSLKFAMIGSLEYPLETTALTSGSML